MSVATPDLAITIASMSFGIVSIAWALRSRHESARVRSSALIDPLTGLFNRRGWSVLVARESARAARERTNLAVFYMDVDDFKSVNDRSGHAAGDAVLVQIANDIRSVARAQDVIARMGGDEFAVLAIDDGSGTFPDGLLSRWAAVFAASGMRVSVGYAVAAEGDVAAALDQADREMYRSKVRAKKNGRSRVAHDGGTVVSPSSKRSIRV